MVHMKTFNAFSLALIFFLAACQNEDLPTSNMPEVAPGEMVIDLNGEIIHFDFVKNGFDRVGKKSFEVRRQSPSGVTMKIHFDISMDLTSGEARSLEDLNYPALIQAPTFASIQIDREALSLQNNPNLTTEKPILKLEKYENGLLYGSFRALLLEVSASELIEPGGEVAGSFCLSVGAVN